jgi:hypothetical protein
MEMEITIYTSVSKAEHTYKREKSKIDGILISESVQDNQTYIEDTSFRDREKSFSKMTIKRVYI